jgi:hypothetical protein
MNWAEIKGNWEGLCPLLKTHWPLLSDADLRQVVGRREELARALRRRYGLGADEAEQRICAFEEEVRFPGAVK